MSDRLMTIVIERDGDMLTAQCDPFDICTQGRTLDELMHRLRLQMFAEIHTAGSLDLVSKLPTRRLVRAGSGSVVSRHGFADWAMVDGGRPAGVVGRWC